MSYELTFYSLFSLSVHGSDIFPVFRISFYWYTSLGLIICIFTGLIISYTTDEIKPPIDLLTPIIHSLLSKSTKENNVMYAGVEEANRKLHVEVDQHNEVTEIKHETLVTS